MLDVAPRVSAGLVVPQGRALWGDAEPGEGPLQAVQGGGEAFRGCSVAVGRGGFEQFLSRAIERAVGQVVRGVSGDRADFRQGRPLSLRLLACEPELVRRAQEPLAVAIPLYPAACSG